MEFLANDLSIHGQFSDLFTFRRAIGRLMAIRQIARRFGRDLHCHRSITYRKVTPSLSLLQAVQELTLDERRALMQWLTRQGPFWEDARVHQPGDYLEFNGKVVTDSAVGEAAYCCIQGLERHLASLDPSSWKFSPVPVTWFAESDPEKTVEVVNHWEPERVAALLQAAPVSLGAWEHLEAIAVARCPNLTFLPHCFDPLSGYPFVPGASQRIVVLLDTLDRFRSCFDRHGQRTREGQRLYQDHFTGDKAWFSDSSDSEKRGFRTKLTFRHPGSEGQSLFCTWHGKVKTPQLRIHFTWPVTADKPLYVAYVGPKITKR